jgi:hypothetical protein
MLTLMAWLFGATSLLAGIVLTVMAIGQVVFGPGPMLLPTVIGSVAAFALAWGCSRHIESARVAERKRLDVVPQPVPVPEGELVLRLRWGKWLLATAVFAGCTAVGMFAMAAAVQGGKLQAVVMACFIVAVLAPATLLLVETGRRAWRVGGVARLDAHGFQHCLLPAVPWKQVRGVDLELHVPGNIKQWQLVLAVDAVLAPALRLGWWWRLAGPGAPRVDAEGRLTVPLAYVRGKPQRLVGQAMSVADRWGAQRIPGWRSYLPPDMAASMHAVKVSSDEATRTMERLMHDLRARGPGKPLAPDEADRVLAQARRSLQDSDRVFEEQMKLLRSGAGK